MKPTHQEFPHRNFQEEVDFLSEIFPSMCNLPAGRRCSRGVSCAWLVTQTVFSLISSSSPVLPLRLLLQMVRPTVWDV